MNNKVLYLIRGVPGSGKSTYAKSLNILDHFEADMFFELSGKYRFDPNKIHKAHQWCQKQAEETMKAGRPLVVSNTFVKKWEMTEYKKLAAKYGYKVIEKIMTGSYKNVHDVPDEKVAQMKTRFEV